MRKCKLLFIAYFSNFLLLSTILYISKSIATYSKWVRWNKRFELTLLCNHGYQLETCSAKTMTREEGGKSPFLTLFKAESMYIMYVLTSTSPHHALRTKEKSDE